MTESEIKNRLEYLRGELRAERISYGELVSEFAPDLSEFNISFDNGDLKVELSPDGEKLVVTASDELRAEMSEDPPRDIYDLLGDYLTTTGGVVGNSDLEWIDPARSGDLTDAPMLGVAKHDESGDVVRVVARWAYMDYQVSDPCQVLADTGRLVFVGGK